jgi:hypothetical protein
MVSSQRQRRVQTGLRASDHRLRASSFSAPERLAFVHRVRVLESRTVTNLLAPFGPGPPALMKTAGGTGNGPGDPSSAGQRRSDVGRRATLQNPGFGARIPGSRRTTRAGKCRMFVRTARLSAPRCAPASRPRDVRKRRTRQSCHCHGCVIPINGCSGSLDSFEAHRPVL